MFRKKKGIPSKAFKSQVTINVPLDKVTTFIYENAFGEIDKDVRAEIISETPFELNKRPCKFKEQYINAHLPAPVKNRTAPMKEFLINNDDESAYIVQVHHPNLPQKKDFLTTFTYPCGFLLKALSPTKTLVESMVHVDPKGSIPKWVHNRIMFGQGKKLEDLKIELEKLYNSGKL